MKICKVLILLFGMSIFLGCEKFVEIDPPQDYLISSTVFEYDETAISAMTGIYASMMNPELLLSYKMPLLTGIYSDELSYNQTYPPLLSANSYALLPKDAPTHPFWDNGFKYIYQANSIIEGLNKSIKISKPVKEQLLGEALFIRAFWYYYLLDFYGSLPLVTTTDYNINLQKTRVGVESINSQIIEDLKLAKDLLSDRYVSANSVSESMDRIRPNTFVASALLARTYLRTKEYSKVVEETSRIISSSTYDLTNLSDVFKRASREVIWQLELPVNTGMYNSYEASFFKLYGKPGNFDYGCAVLTDDLLSLFGSNDQRKNVWMDSFLDDTTIPSVAYVYPSKMKSESAPSDEYTTPFRLAEIFLIRAEAKAYLGLLDQSIDDADKTRIRSGLNSLRVSSVNISQEDLLDSIQIEKRRELFCEWGIRWADIHRQPNPNSIMEVIAERKNVIWRSSAILWPIPVNEILNSANKIKQNDGYN